MTTESNELYVISSVQSPPADIYISFERLAKSTVELQSLLQVERDRNFALLEENFSLKLKLGQKVSTDCKVNKGYNYPMICALVKFNFRYEFESLHKNRHLEVKTAV